MNAFGESCTFLSKTAASAANLAVQAKCFPITVMGVKCQVFLPPPLGELNLGHLEFSGFGCIEPCLLKISEPRKAEALKTKDEQLKLGLNVGVVDGSTK